LFKEVGARGWVVGGCTNLGKYEEYRIFLLTDIMFPEGKFPLGNLVKI